MKILLPFLAIFALLYSFSPPMEKGLKGVDQGIDLRAIYSSGDPSTWPAPHLFEEAKEGFEDIGALPKAKFPKNNPYSKDKEELGKMLFFDPRLSQSGQISCASCHDPELTPTLREVSHTAPYMHNGLFPDIRGVLNMYNAGMPNEKWKENGRGISPKKSGMLTGLNLSETELVDIENFLKSLHSLRYKMRAPELPK